jgi:hypothetical protein
MCFSAHASFAASAVLAGTGVAALRSAETPAQRLFAAIPFLFAVQQFYEGLLWLSLSSPALSPGYLVPMHAYFFIAMAVWPLWLPFSVWMMEEVPDIKRKLLLPLAIGGVVFAYYAFFQLARGVHANIACYHVQYVFDYPLNGLANAVYMLAVAPPLFLSSWRFMRISGVSLLMALAVAQLFYWEFSLTVWCFFAAALSMQVLWVLVAHHTQGNREVGWLWKSSR